MAPISKADMVEATRLTRQGLLKEAMAVLRGDASGKEAQSASEPGGLAAGIKFAPARAKAKDFGDLERPLPKGARFESLAYQSGSTRRSYKLYVPSHGGDTERPLIVMLHGCTQSPDDFARGTRMNEIAEQHGFLVAYPEQTQAANTSKCWNWFKVEDQRRDQGEPALIAGINHQVMAKLKVDHRRVFVAGLSAGGAAAAIMGATYPDLYSGVGVHSGLACGAASDMNTAFAAMRQGADGARVTSMPVPTVVFHGDHDATVSPANGEAVIAQVAGKRTLRADTSSGTSKGGVRYTRTVWTGANGEPAMERWVLHGSGHAWSGGSAAGTFTDPKGPDASRETVRFFLSLRR